MIDIHDVKGMDIPTYTPDEIRERTSETDIQELREMLFGDYYLPPEEYHDRM